MTVETMSRSRPVSPLASATSRFEALPAGVQVRELPLLVQLDLRLDPNGPAGVAVAEVLGVAVPQRPCTAVTAGDVSVLWLGPDEWLVRSAMTHDATRTAPLQAALGTAFAGVFASAVDIGSGYTVLEISGTRTREVLSRGCPLDLHPKLFGEGQCAQSHYFKASITLVPTGADSFDIVVRRSFADYFVKIMLDAAEPLMS